MKSDCGEQHLNGDSIVVKKVDQQHHLEDDDEEKSTNVDANPTINPPTSEAPSETSPPRVKGIPESAELPEGSFSHQLQIIEEHQQEERTISVAAPTSSSTTPPQVTLPNGLKLQNVLIQRSSTCAHMVFAFDGLHLRVPIDSRAILVDAPNHNEPGHNNTTNENTVMTAPTDWWNTVSLFCPEENCDQERSDLIRLNVHIRNDHHKSPRQCLLLGCEAQLPDLSMLNHHTKTAHRSIITWTCYQCRRPFLSHKELSGHYSVCHQRGVFECTRCQYKEHYAAKVIEHYIEMHLSGQQGNQNE